MPRVFLPSALRPLVDGRATVEAEGRTVRAVIDELDQRYPGVKERLCQDNQLRAGLAVVVGGAVSPLGMLQSVEPADEVHFLPAIGGG